jgi:hypothetical protein
MADKTAPAIAIKTTAKAVGRKARISIEAEEPKYGVRDLRAVLVQGTLQVPLGEMTNPASGPSWRFWQRREVRSGALLEVEIGRDRVPELKEGPVTIRAEATNASWARFGKGRTTVVESTFPVMLTPPRVEVLSGQHYIRQGGSEWSSTGRPKPQSDRRAGRRLLLSGLSARGRAPGTRFATRSRPSGATVPCSSRDAADEGRAKFW